MRASLFLLLILLPFALARAETDFAAVAFHDVVDFPGISMTTQ
jgi:hypothetical protein